MSTMTVEQLREKISNCMGILASHKCMDELFILFVACEYFMYCAALNSEIHTPNRSVASEAFKFGLSAFLYRNAFAHCESVETLTSMVNDLSAYRDLICSYFTDEVRDKVFSSLS